jgi:hypothetical protein
MTEANDKPDLPAAAETDSEQPEAFVIPRELAQATLNYLAAQPYREVFPLVQAFESLEPLPAPSPE